MFCPSRYRQLLLALSNGNFDPSHPAENAELISKGVNPCQRLARVRLAINQQVRRTMATQIREIVIKPGRSFRVAVDSEASDAYGQALLNKSFWLRYEWELLARFLPATGGRFLDLGGHLGSFTLTAAAHGHQVVVVEASPTNAGLIRQSVAANQFDQVQVVHAAVYREAKTLQFFDNGPFGFLIEHQHPKCVEVPALPTNEILARTGWDRIDVIKMDIEGAEVWAIDAMEDILSRPDAPVIYYECNSRTLHDFGHTSCRALQERLESLGYRSFVCTDERTPLRPVRANEWQPEIMTNCLAVKLGSHPLHTASMWTRMVRNNWRRCLGRQPFSSWLKGLPVRESATKAEVLVATRQAIAGQSEAIMREHLERELPGAPEWIQADPMVREFLRDSKKDLAKAA